MVLKVTHAKNVTVWASTKPASILFIINDIIDINECDTSKFVDDTKIGKAKSRTKRENRRPKTLQNGISQLFK